MNRNFFRRVEVAFPVQDKKLRQRIVKEGLELYLSDNTEAWVLQKEGDYKRRVPAGKQRKRSAQQALLSKI